MRLLAQRLAVEARIEARLEKKVVTASDNFPFFANGVPVLCVGTQRAGGNAGRGFGHTQADSIDKIAETDLKRATISLVQLLLRLATADTPLPRHHTPDQAAQLLREADQEEALRLADNWRFEV